MTDIATIIAQRDAAIAAAGRVAVRLTAERDAALARVAELEEAVTQRNETISWFLAQPPEHELTEVWAEWFSRRPAHYVGLLDVISQSVLAERGDADA